jgi:hypothetical protein
MAAPHEATEHVDLDPPGSICSGDRIRLGEQLWSRVAALAGGWPASTDPGYTHATQKESDC